MISRKIGGLEIFFEDSVKYEEYSCKWYEVLTLYIEENQYDIVNNYIMGYRLNIKKSDGSWKDIPFRENSFEFIPNVKVKRHE